MIKSQLRKIIKEEIANSLREEIKEGDKVKYLARPVQGANFFFEYGPLEVVKINNTTIVINQGYKDSTHPKGPKWSEMTSTIHKDKIFPYPGYKKSASGKKNGKQMWVPKDTEE